MVEARQGIYTEGGRLLLCSMVLCQGKWTVTPMIRFPLMSNSTSRTLRVRAFASLVRYDFGVNSPTRNRPWTPTRCTSITKALAGGWTPRFPTNQTYNIMCYDATHKDPPAKLRGRRRVLPRGRVNSNQPLNREGNSVAEGPGGTPLDSTHHPYQ